MSLYWQQALPNGDQNLGGQQQPQGEAQTSQWDYILGGAPAPQYQWGQYSQSNETAQSPQQQQPQQHRGGSAEVPNSNGYQQAYQQNGVPQGGYQNQYNTGAQQNYQQAQHQQHGYNQQAQQAQQQYYQPSQYLQPTGNEVQHTPLLPKEGSQSQMEKANAVSYKATEEGQYWNYQQQLGQYQHQYHQNQSFVQPTPDSYPQNSQLTTSSPAVGGWTAAHAHYTTAEANATIAGVTAPQVANPQCTPQQLQPIVEENSMKSATLPVTQDRKEENVVVSEVTGNSLVNQEVNLDNSGALQPIESGVITSNLDSGFTENVCRDENFQPTQAAADYRELHGTEIVQPAANLVQPKKQSTPIDQVMYADNSTKSANPINQAVDFVESTNKSIPHVPSESDVVLVNAANCQEQLEDTTVSVNFGETPESETGDRSSSQVTPESCSYSVETFGSQEGNPPAGVAVDTGNTTTAEEKANDWEYWENQEAQEGKEERSPGVESQTQSEPACYYGAADSKDCSREVSAAPSSNGWEREMTPQMGQQGTGSSGGEVQREESEHRSGPDSCQPVVAQVAPLVKKPSLEPPEQPIARVEPVVSQPSSVDPSNVQRVAPTRPIVAASQEEREQVEPSTQPTDPFTPLEPPVSVAQPQPPAAPNPPPEVNAVETVAAQQPAAVQPGIQPATQPVSSEDRRQEVEQPTVSVTTITPSPGESQPSSRERSLPAHDQPLASSERLNPSGPSPSGDLPITPDLLMTSEMESPGQAQATSTPITEQDLLRTVTSRRGSSSSIRSGAVGPTTKKQLPPAQASGEHSDSTQGSLSFTRNSNGIRSSYHERYRGVKEKYLDSRNEVSQAMQRLDRHRVDTPRMKKTNPLVDMSLPSGRRSVQLAMSAAAASRGNGGNTTDISMDGSMQYKQDADKLNMSTYSQVDPSLNHSIDISKVTSGYGDDFVDAARRSRLNRSSRPASRAKSEINETGPYRGGRQPIGYEYGPYGGMHPHHPQYYPGFHSMGRHSGRLSAAAMPYHQQDYYQQQHQMMMYEEYKRAHSTYDPRAMERFQRAGGNLSSYDAFSRQPDEDDIESLSDESESEEIEEELEGEGGESEDEMRRYNMAHSLKPSRSGYSVASSMHVGQMTIPRQARYGQEESYYFGIIRLEQDAVDQVFRRMPPPRDFFTLLQPHEKAAYLYYASVYNRLFSSVAEFQNKFNREFYKYVCEGDSKNTALCKICKSMFDEYNLKRLTNQQKAYEASQKQLFSDDRDSADGLSDRASLYEKDDDLASDIMSIDTSQRAPLKHRTPHAFVTFGPGGKMVTVHPDVSVSMVQIDDVKKVLKDDHSQRLIDSAQMFRGPLIEGKTPAHSVRLYIQRQIEKIRSSEVATENPRDNDVIDCLLVWQLLEMVVQQQGRVTGPDVARLLIAAGSSTTRQPHSHHREKSATPSTTSESVLERRSPADPRAYERFTQFLLGGHVDEAVECAIRDGLYADAMILARRLFAGDERRLADIETRFLATRPAINPVMTLVSVASGQPAPILTNPPVDDSGSWRTHAAMVLANLNTSHAMQTVYGLGRVLAKREYNAAADFCLLAVALLSSFDIFQPVMQSEEDANVRQHISLIHASLPDDEWDSTQCRFGFSLTDLHATEIFDYAIRLAQRPSPLQNSVEFQRRRFQYAKLLADFGGFSTDSFRYCLSVASSVWSYYHMLTAVELNELAELADRLRFSAAEDASDTTWIDSLRGMIAQMPQSSGMMGGGGQGQQEQQQAYEQPQQPQGAVSQVADHNQQAHQQMEAPAAQQHQQQPEQDMRASRSRSESLATEARDWHADHQDPLQMSPQGGNRDVAAVFTSPAPDCIASPQMTDYKTPRERVGSIGNQQQLSFGEQLCQQAAGSPPDIPSAASRSHADDSCGTTTEEMTSSQESTPVRQQNQRRPSHETASHQPQSIPEMPPQQQFAPIPQPPAAPAEQQQNNYQQGQQQQQQQRRPSVQPTQQPQQNRSQSPQNGAANQREPAGDLKKNNNSTGMLAKFLRKVIPDSNSMILPDDKNPQIRWDEATQKWVGDGVESEATAAAPPPKMESTDNGGTPPTMVAGGGGLRAARVSGGSRYFNPLTGGSNGGSSGGPSPAPSMPSMPIPTSFGFIPTMPDDADGCDPFSADAGPPSQQPGAEQPTAEAK